jgi:dTDP-4-dehydrorhamnose 3,5-epimerase
VHFSATELPGVHVVDLERREDDRGYFARTFCEDEFRAHGLEPRVTQASVSHNRRRGTLRGMHYQASPHEEAKLVRCTRGAIFDVALDLRRDSPSFRRWYAVELSADNGRALYVPPGVAHGFQTLDDDTDVLYQMSEPHHPDAARGVRFDDPQFAIPWPLERPIVNERDRAYPDFVA